MKVLHYILIITLVSAVVSSCKKKADFEYDNRLTNAHFANSSARIVNISDYAQVTVNGKALTNFLPQILGNVPPVKGTLYFPTTGSLANNGKTWYISQDLINADGSAQVTLTKLNQRYGGSNGSSVNDTIKPASFKAIDNFNNPVDYYAVYWGSHYTGFSGGDTVIAVPREVSAPSDPTHFKIRVLNLLDKDDPSNLKGPLTLTYADGTPVSATTTNVKQGAHSDYIELPYGSYQFKLQTATGAQLPGASNTGLDMSALFVDPYTGIMVDGYNNFLNNVIAPLQSYEPGGVYTIVASVNGTFLPYYNEGNVFINSFRAIADISTPPNLTYARLQAVNVIPGSGISVTVDGKALGAGIAYGTATDYQIFVKGVHDVRAVDANGNLLAEQTLNVTGNDVWTAWVYTNKGKAAIAFATDNLSGNYFNGSLAGDNQSGAANINNYMFSSPIRFLNFCEDLPYATFADQNGQPLQQNLAPGQVVTASAYTLNSASTVPINEIRAYQSQASPLVVPGNWLSDVTSLVPSNFIVNPGMYSKGNFKGIPKTEFGAYTVALIGSLKSAASTSEKARLLIIKHNR